MKINRLLEIAIILMNRGSVTARELADRFEVSTRTIYRDVDVLSGAGVPVYTCKGSNGGIHLMEDYSLTKTIVNDHEADSLILALKTLQVTKYPDISATLDKLGALFKRSAQNDWVRIDFSPWGSEPNEDNKFVNIKMAILNKKVITFDYINSLGERSERSVEPLQLIYKGQAWYLWGWCTNKQDHRMFRISRIKKLTVTDRCFASRSFEIKGDAKKPVIAPRFINAILRFNSEIMHRVYDDYDEEIIKRNADGTCDVSVTFPEDEWVYGYILSFGSFIEVIAPESLRTAVKERLERALGHYSKSYDTQ